MATHTRTFALVLLVLGFSSLALAQKPRPKQAPPVVGKRLPMRIQIELQEKLKTQPVAAFKLLKANADELTEDEKLVLGHEAAETVAIVVESSRDTIAGLATARAAHAVAEGQPDAIRASLERSCHSAERRVLAEALNAVRSRAGRWGECAREAQTRQGELSDKRLDEFRDTETAEFRVRLVEAREVLTRLREVSLRAEATDAFAKALSESKPELFKRINRAAMSAKLARQADSQEGMAELRPWIAGKWVKAPDVQAVKSAVTKFARGLGDVEKVNADLDKRLLQDLAVKALLDGHSDAAMQLLPEGGPRDNAAKLLADLTSLALGEGKVTTGPATMSEKATGLDAIIPTTQKVRKPPAKEKGETNFDRAEKVAATLMALAEKSVPVEAADALEKANQAVKTLTALADRVMAPELAERKSLTAVEAELDRRLTPAERVQVRTLLAQKKPIVSIADELKKQPAKDEEAEFLAEVERRRGRPLGSEQEAQAKRLRKQGRSSAEVAEILGQ